jgi:hypothetical protein
MPRRIHRPAFCSLCWGHSGRAEAGGSRWPSAHGRPVASSPAPDRPKWLICPALSPPPPPQMCQPMPPAAPLGREGKMAQRGRPPASSLRLNLFGLLLLERHAVVVSPGAARQLARRGWCARAWLPAQRSRPCLSRLAKETYAPPWRPAPPVAGQRCAQSETPVDYEESCSGSLWKVCL